MQIWYQTVKFKRQMTCEECGRVIARRATVSRVCDNRGNWIEAVGIDDDPRADYRLQCNCGHRIEIQSPEDVEQWKLPDIGEEPTGPTVLRLT